MTSAPTAMLKCAATGHPFLMPYQGREHFHFVSDVGAGFAEAAVASFEGYGVFNLRGITMHTEEFIETIQVVAAGLGIENVDIGIASDAKGMPFVYDLDADDSLAAFPKMPLTSLEAGIQTSLKAFRKMEAAGELDVGYHPGG